MAAHFCDYRMLQMVDELPVDGPIPIVDLILMDTTDRWDSAVVGGTLPAIRANALRHGFVKAESSGGVLLFVRNPASREHR